MYKKGRGKCPNRQIPSLLEYRSAWTFDERSDLANAKRLRGSARKSSGIYVTSQMEVKMGLTGILVGVIGVSIIVAVIVAAVTAVIAGVVGSNEADTE